MKINWIKLVGFCSSEVGEIERIMHVATSLIRLVVLPALLVAHCADASSLVGLPKSLSGSPTLQQPPGSLPPSLQQDPLDQGAGLSEDEGEILSALRQHLNKNLAEYQRDLHVSYSEQAREYSHRKKRGILILVHILIFRLVYIHTYTYIQYAFSASFP